MCVWLPVCLCVCAGWVCLCFIKEVAIQELGLWSEIEVTVAGVLA